MSRKSNQSRALLLSSPDLSVKIAAARQLLRRLEARYHRTIDLDDEYERIECQTSELSRMDRSDVVFLHGLVARGTDQDADTAAPVRMRCSGCGSHTEKLLSPDHVWRLAPCERCGEATRWERI